MRAQNFTPWLAKNLDLLGKVLGMKLEEVQQEAPIGPFSLDILAREAERGVIVAIENQLEETDLTHLGQLLTYATGCGAHVAIWVAPYFGYEHAQALHRLNEWSSERIRFYGVKVDVVREEGSELTPRLRKVVYPGGWDKNLTLRSREMSPTHPEVLRLLPAADRRAAWGGLRRKAGPALRPLLPALSLPPQRRHMVRGIPRRSERCLGDPAH